MASNPFDQFDGVVSGPPPGFQYKEPQAAADLRGRNLSNVNTVANTDRTRNDIVNSNRGSAPQGYQYTPDGRLVPIVNAPQAAPPSGYRYKPDGGLELIPGASVSPDKVAEAQGKLPQIALAEKDLADLRNLYAKGPGATHGLFGVQDYFGTPTNKAFDQKADTFRGVVMAARGLTASQTNSPEEVRTQIDPYIPHASDFDSNILQKMDELQNLINAQKGSVAAQSGGTIPAPPPQDDKNAVPPVFNPGAPSGGPGGGGPGGGGGGLPGNPLINGAAFDTRGNPISLVQPGQNYMVGADPTLAGVNEHVRSLIGSPRPMTRCCPG